MARNSFALFFVVLFVNVTLGQSTEPLLKVAKPKSGESKKSVSTSDFELEDSARNDRVIPIRVYHDGAKDKYPVILFSHGLGGSRTNSPFWETIGRRTGTSQFSCNTTAVILM